MAPIHLRGGEISNQGISDLSLTSGTPSYTDSPLMKALSLKTKKYFTSSGLTQMKNSFTIMFFAKNTGTSADYVAFNLRSGTSTNCQFTIYQANRKIMFQDPDTVIVTTSTVAGADVDTSWHHICVRCDGTYVKTFVDGEEKTSTSYQSDTTKQASFTKDFNLGSGDSRVSQTDGICDFRVYDEPISLKLIKNISKGMIYHYSLDNYHGGPENYAQGVYNNEYSNTYKASGWQDCFELITSKALTASKYTVSFTARADNDGSIITNYFYNPNTTTNVVNSQGYSGTGSDGSNIITLTKNWADYWITYTQSETTSVKHFIIGRTHSEHGTSGSKIYFKNVRIQEGDASTFVPPAQSDSIYTTFGFNSNTIPDESGLGEDAMGTGNSSEPVSKSSKDFPISNIAAYLDGKSYFTFPTHFTIGQQVSQLSLACYVYITYNNIISLGGNSFIRFRPQSGGTEILYTNTSGEVIANKIIAGNIGINIWRHVCITYKDGIFKQYLDGILAGTLDATANGKYMTCGRNITGYIGCYLANSETMIGYVSDVRIYGTCLDATDIANLYQSVAHITNMGDMVINGQLIEEC